MLRTTRDEEFSAFVVAHRVGLLRFSCLLAAGDTQLAEDLVQTALARLYVAWPRVRRTGAENAYARRIIVNAHTDELRLSAAAGSAPSPTSPRTCRSSRRAGCRTASTATGSARPWPRCRPGCAPRLCCGTGWISASPRPPGCCGAPRAP